MLRLVLVTLGDPARPTGGYLFHRRLAELAPRFDARIDFLSFPNWPFPLPIAAGPRILRQSVQLQADGLVLDSIAAAYLGPWLGLRRHRLPVVGMLHQPPGGIDHGPLRTAVQVALDRLAYRSAHRLLVASQVLAGKLAAAGFPHDAIRVVPPGRDVAAVSDESLVDLRLGRQAAFLCVGNWQPRKGIYCLLEAFARLPAGAGTLHLVGDPRVDAPYHRRIADRLTRPDLSQRVVVHGVVPRERVAAFYRAADVFVLPSFVEPYGTVYGEAMTYGLPVVGWRAGNLPNLVDDGVEGILVTPGDLAGLAAALLRLAQDPVLRSRLSEAARRRATALPTWADTASRFFTELRDALGAPSTSVVIAGERTGA